MSGIYLHIPFCKQACHYCDFHFSTSFGLKEKMVAALCREVALRADYLSDTVNTIYFGGGTPSVLSSREIEQLLETIHQTFAIAPNTEITLEANPDDLSIEKLEAFRAAGINRLSIGIQSFNEAHLRYLNRAHDSRQARKAVERARAAGFDNITIDLIYAIPGEDHRAWKQDLQLATDLEVPHVSAYCLTIEEKTVFGNWQKKGKIAPINESFAAEQFGLMLGAFTKCGLDLYEVSNFARKGWQSKHNTNYWLQVPYLGLGPGAHSYNSHSRQYNIANNPKYISAITEGQVPCTFETLSLQDKINEYWMTSLRTAWGADLAWLKKQYGFELLPEQQANIERHIARGNTQKIGDKLKLTSQGLLFADQIASELFV